MVANILGSADSGIEDKFRAAFINKYLKSLFYTVLRKRYSAGLKTIFIKNFAIIFHVLLLLYELN